MGDIKKKLNKVAGSSVFAAAFLAAATPSDAQALEHASIAVDVHSGKILHNENGFKAMKPASTIKILTLLGAFKAERDFPGFMDKTITVSSAARNQACNEGMSGMSTLTMRKAMEVMVLRSKNDLAEEIERRVVQQYGMSPTEENRTKFRNQLAQEAGMDDSYITNPSGLPYRCSTSGRRVGGRDMKMKVTAKDMADLLIYAHDKYPEMIDFMGLDFVEGSSWADKASSSTNRMILGTMSDEEWIAAKTGTTRDGSNLAGIYENWEKEIAFVTLGNANSVRRRIDFNAITERAERDLGVEKAERQKLSAMYAAMGRNGGTLPDDYKFVPTHQPRMKAHTHIAQFKRKTPLVTTDVEYGGSFEDMVNNMPPSRAAPEKSPMRPEPDNTPDDVMIDDIRQEDELAANNVKRSPLPYIY